jgi:hypothetical protein
MKCARIGTGLNGAAIAADDASSSAKCWSEWQGCDRSLSAKFATTLFLVSSNGPTPYDFLELFDTWLIISSTRERNVRRTREVLALW